MKKTAILFGAVLFCLCSFAPRFNARTVNAAALVKSAYKPTPGIDGPTVICNDGRMYTYSVTGLPLGDTTTWTWTVSGQVSFSGGQNTGTSVDIFYDPSASGSTIHGVIQGFRSTGGSVLRHFDIITCP